MKPLRIAAMELSVNNAGILKTLGGLTMPELDQRPEIFRKQKKVGHFQIYI
jgi:hypothetical protein